MYRIRLWVLAGMILGLVSVFFAQEQVMASPAAVLPTRCEDIFSLPDVPMPEGQEQVFRLQCQAEWEADIRAEWYEEMSQLESMAGIVYDPL